MQGKPLGAKKMKCCDIVYYKHPDPEFGWDAYKKEDCYRLNGEWIPTWFDSAIIQEYKTKKLAMQEIASRHVFGICLIN
jgi:hypothetical protein